MNFIAKVKSKYCCLGSEIENLIKESEEELNEIETEMKSVRREYHDLIKDEDATYEQLLALEKKLDALEDDRIKAEKKYENARNLTLQDLKEEQAWKGDR